LKLKKRQINQLNSVGGKVGIVDIDQTALKNPNSVPNEPLITLLVSKIKTPTKIFLVGGN
jgi:hypothetical protein